MKNVVRFLCVAALLLVVAITVSKSEASIEATAAPLMSENAECCLPFPPRDDCGCIIRPRNAPWYIVEWPCDELCPDGTPSVPGLGH
ncbi:MAG: hypothetical protein KTR13_08380 [Saprospiraceae bacterium]|nr:hypothetical protein [Saprospiraceae bacterium]